MTQISEPATLLTDLLMAALACVWFLRLGRGKAMPIVGDWRRTFLWLAIASLLGGTYHGFHALLPDPLSVLLWRGTMASAALINAFILLAGSGQFGAGSQAGWRWFAWTKAATVLVLGQVWPEFLLVLLDAAASLIPVVALALRGLGRTWNARAKFMAGVGLFVAGGVVQALGLAPHPAFNHNDLFHVLQIFGNWMFYLCARESLTVSGAPGALPARTQP